MRSTTSATWAFCLDLGFPDSGSSRDGPTTARGRNIIHASPPHAHPRARVLAWYGGRRGKRGDMAERRRTMPARKRIALIAHDNRKQDLLEWARFNVGTLGQHDLFATGTTGGLLAHELGLEVTRYLSGPLGGDQQVGAAI